MNNWRVDATRVKICVLVLCYTAGWTWIMSVVLRFALFFAADSRCSGEPPRANMNGGLVIAVVCVWVSPFVAAAVWRRSVVSVIAALIATVVGVAVVVDTFASPDAFCF